MPFLLHVNSSIQQGDDSMKGTAAYSLVIYLGMIVYSIHLGNVESCVGWACAALWAVISFSQAEKLEKNADPPSTVKKSALPPVAPRDRS